MDRTKGIAVVLVSLALGGGAGALAGGCGEDRGSLEVEGGGGTTGSTGTAPTTTVP